MKKSFPYRLIACAILALASYHSSFAQVTLLLNGKVTDETTGKPVGVKYEIIAAAGEKIQGKSNSKTGEYQAILNPGTRYTINFSGYDILKKSETFTTNAASEYTEQARNFTVRKLSSGMPLFALNAFRPGMAELSSDSKAKLDDIKAMMKENRLMTLGVAVYIADTKFAKPEPPKAQKVAAKKGKKGKKVEEPAPAPAPVPSGPSPEEIQLANARLDAVKAYLADVKNAEMRIKFTANAEDKSAKENLNVNIGEVKDMFE